MKLYKVKNWEELYENSRSRSVDKLRWVPIPNNHDGEHYSRLMLRKDASEIFSAWILILQVSSKCHPRGTLVRSDGKPHDEESLSLKTRAPVLWFSKAIPVLLQMAWIEQVTTECQAPITQPSPDYHPTVIEGKEGMEGMKEIAEVALRAPLSPCSVKKEGIILTATSKGKELIEAWCKAYQGRFGYPYKVQAGKDTKAAAGLARLGVPVGELLGIASKAWERLDGFNTGQAASLAGFAGRFNEIRIEVNGEKSKKIINNI